jgi:toxin HigB-1
MRKGWSVIQSFRHRGLQRLYERGDASRLNADHVQRLRLILTLLDAATKPSDMNFPGSGFHALRGNLRGFYAVRVSGNWRVIFRFENAGAYDVDYLDYH